MAANSTKVRWDIWGYILCFLGHKEKYENKSTCPCAVNGKTGKYMVVAKRKKNAPDLFIYWQGAGGWSLACF